MISMLQTTPTIRSTFSHAAASAPAARAAVAAPSVQFVLAVESGAMETMTLRLVQSVRRWGGKYAWSGVLAVRPRLGAPLRRSTLREFDRLGVAYRQVRPDHGFTWYTWMNKPTALIAAEQSTD